MSTTETDEKRQVVQGSPPDQGTVVVERPTTVVQERPATVVQQTPAKQETVVRHTSTNTGALAAIAIGLIVLVGGMGIIASQIQFLPWPYSLIVILGFGLILLMIGASMIGRGTDKT